MLSASHHPRGRASPNLSSGQPEADVGLTGLSPGPGDCQHLSYNTHDFSCPAGHRQAAPDEPPKRGRYPSDSPRGARKTASISTVNRKGNANANSHRRPGKRPRHRDLYKDWGTGQPVVFSHGWPLTADVWDGPANFVASHGFRAVAHDRRGGGRSSQPWVAMISITMPMIWPP